MNRRLPVAGLGGMQYNQRMKLIQQRFEIDSEQAGDRLDQVLHRLLPDYSRSRIQQWIQQGFVCLNQTGCKPRQKVHDGDVVDLDVPRQTETADLAEPLEFEILHEDAALFVVNKPAGLVVHPAAGHRDGTLVNGLLALDADLAQLPRAGIVHRLDKDTTGVMVVARTLAAHAWLVARLQAREVSREYLAICRGVVTAGRRIATGIARHPRERKKMSVQAGGKPAITEFEVLRRFRHYSLLRVRLETGRTHQIRVHLAHLHHPLVGDPVYGGRGRVAAGVAPALAAQIDGFRRQALHAERLRFVHPSSREPVEFSAPPPADFAALLAALETHD